MIHVDNLAQFSAGLEAWIEECEALAEARLKALALGAFEFILVGTPQWSGELVSAWTITMGAPAAGSPPGIFKDADLPLGPGGPQPYSRVRPNEAAVNYARSIGKSSLANVRLGGEIFITNTAPYADLVELNRNEKGQTFIRQVNMPIEMVHAAVDKFGGVHE